MKKIIQTILLSTTLVCSTTYAASTPKIVSAGGSITEVIYALGKEDWVVATDSTSRYPEAANSLPKVGYFRQIGAESVLSFRPTHLIGAQATGPKDVLTQLTAAGLKVTIMGEDKSLDGLLTMILEIGELLGARETAEALSLKLSSKVQSLSLQVPKGKEVKGLFVLSNADRGLTVAGNNTVPQALFDAAKISNAAHELSNYKVLDNEAIAAQQPDFILLASHRFTDASDIKSICQHPSLIMTPAGKHCRVLVMDSSTSLGLSPRFPQALEQLIEFAYFDDGESLQGE